MNEQYLETLSATVRQNRNQLLSESDVVVLRAYEANTPVPQAWVEYRQALRDMTLSQGFPQNFSFPVKPTE
jgi:hypothetical protein